MSEINRGLDHMANLQRGWSPGQAMLPPDPGGLNRALDRAAAEHLREVAPHLAPSAPAPPQPEPRTCHCGAYTASECECRKRAPNAPPQLERDELGRLCVNGQPHRPADPRMLGAPFCVVCYHPLAPAPPAEAKGEQHCQWGVCALPHTELTREEFETAIHRMAVSAHGITKVLAHDAALRTRAREESERAEKWRSELSAACELSERYRSIVTEALNQPPAYWYDKHDNGEWSAEHAAFAIAALFRERDEAREQREDLANEILAGRSDLAAANARAEEAEKKIRAAENDAVMARNDKVAAQRTADSNHRLAENERAARQRAEREREELRAAWIAEDAEIRQVLGGALGYPAPPDAQPGDGVVTGPHTGTTLADEAAERITVLRAKVERLKTELAEERKAAALDTLRAVEAERDILSEAVRDADRLIGIEREARQRAEKERDEAFNGSTQEARDTVQILRSWSAAGIAALRAEVERLRVAPCPICAGSPPASGKPCACNGTNSVYVALNYLLGVVAEEDVRRENLRAAITRLVGAGQPLLSIVRQYSGMTWDQDRCEPICEEWNAARNAALAARGDDKP